jgi:hypothetical protein
LKNNLFVYGRQFFRKAERRGIKAIMILDLTIKFL